ncbi:MAG: DcaP family trimeric outer membrane transporter [Paracoccaceae bacterium]|nr:DcaP family trimeric outer membrane transporter [Paracoccaceae bacterium]
MTTKRAAVKTVGAAMVLAAGMAASASAQSVEQQLADLRAQVADITGDGTKGFRISPNTRLKVYGYIKADFIYDDNFDLGNDIFNIVGVAPGDAEETNFRTHARQSRFGIWTYTDTAMGELQTRIEGDFYGNGGTSGNFRLRHAYGQIGPWLIGRTWTNFMPIESYPDSLDFQGPAGIPFVRTEQVRYTHDFGNGLGAAFSIEGNPGGGTTASPAFVASTNYSFGSSFVKLAGVYRKIDTTPGSGEQDSWGVNVSGNTSLWQGGTLSATYTIGEGIANYMVFGGDDFTGLDNTVKTTAFLVGLNQEITDKVSVGLIYGNRDDDAGDAVTGSTKIETVHASVYYKPVEKVQVGLEYIYAQRTLFGGQTVDNSRVQASAQFNF